MDSSEPLQNSLAELYKKRLLAEFHHPSGGGEPDKTAKKGWARNRTCGDEVSFYSLVCEKRIAQCWQDTSGCAISTATASLLVNALKGKTVEDSLDLLARIRSTVFEGADGELEGELTNLQAIHDLPSRHECVGVALTAAERSLNETY